MLLYLQCSTYLKFFKLCYLPFLNPACMSLVNKDKCRDYSLSHDKFSHQPPWFININSTVQCVEQNFNILKKTHAMLCLYFDFQW